jgi:hypothetical protein
MLLPRITSSSLGLVIISGMFNPKTSEVTQHINDGTSSGSTATDTGFFCMLVAGSPSKEVAGAPATLFSKVLPAFRSITASPDALHTWENLDVFVLRQSSSLA